MRADLTGGAADRLAADIRCPSCGRDLVDLSPEGHCPQCGVPVAKSARRDLLRYLDPAWVETLVSGTTWTMAGIPVGVFAGVAAGLVQAATSEPEYSLLLTVMGGLVGLIGIWKLTTPEPDETGSSGLTARELARYGSAGGYLLNLLHQWLMVGDAGLASYVGLPAALLGLATIVATFIYARQMAMRIPDENLVKQTGRVMSGMITLTVLWLVLNVLSAFAGPLPSSAVSSGRPTNPLAGFTPALGIMMGLGCFAGMMAFTLMIWNLILLNRFRRAFIEAARHARVARAS